MKKCFAPILILTLALTACDQPAYRTACDSAAKIASSLGALESLNESLYHSGTIGKDETIAIGEGVDAATRVNDEFVARLRTIKSVDATNAQQVGAWLQEVVASLDKLNQQGVLQVKNPEARAQLSAAFQAAGAAAQLIANLIANAKQPAKAAAGPRDLFRTHTPNNPQLSVIAGSRLPGASRRANVTQRPLFIKERAA